jgi:uncharacterized membrane protein YraQ (UPF0718 family)
MQITIAVMSLLAGVLTIVAYLKDHRFPLDGLKAGGKLFLDISPAMILAFISAGMITKVLPREILTRWLGEESGIHGLIIATLASALTPGGPLYSVSHCSRALEKRRRRCARCGLPERMVFIGR